MLTNMTRDRYQNNDDFDWVNWELVPLEPKWLYHNIMDKCKKEGIPIRILRVKQEDGKETLIVQKRTEVK